MEPRGINGVAREDPDRIALVAGDRRMSFAELDADANRIAHVLTGAGVGPGDRVAMLMPNVPDFPRRTSCWVETTSARSRGDTMLRLRHWKRHEN